MHQSVETKGQTAERLFYEGYNCCQSVAGAFADEMGLPMDTVLRLASGFGGGVGRMREMCGAVSGMVLVTGMLRGYTSPQAVQEKSETYAQVQAIVQHFRAENGSILCRDLLGLQVGPLSSQPDARTPEYYATRPCAKLCHVAADILAQMLAK